MNGSVRMHGGRVRQARYMLGETQRVFAMRVGLHPSMLSRLETGGLALVPEMRGLEIAVHSGFPLEWFARHPTPPLDLDWVPETNEKGEAR